GGSTDGRPSATSGRWGARAGRSAATSGVLGGGGTTGASGSRARGGAGDRGSREFLGGGGGARPPFPGGRAGAGPGEGIRPSGAGVGAEGGVASPSSTAGILTSALQTGHRTRRPANASGAFSDLPHWQRTLIAINPPPPARWTGRHADR